MPSGRPSNLNNLDQSTSVSRGFLTIGIKCGLLLILGEPGLLHPKSHVSRRLRWRLRPGATAQGMARPRRGARVLVWLGLRLSVQVECFSGAAGSSSVSVQLQCGLTLHGGATTDGGCSEAIVAVLLSRRNRPYVFGAAF